MFLANNLLSRRHSLIPPNCYKMCILSWNIRGYKIPLKTIILKRKIEIEKPIVVMLQETKCLEEELKTIGKKIWKKCVVVDSDAIGVVGGIWIL